MTGGEAGAKTQASPRIGGAQPPHVQVLAMASGKWLSQPLAVAARLEIPDRCAEGPRTVTELSAETGTLEDPLRRCLRVLAMVGVLAEDDAGRFALGPLGGCLRADAMPSVRDFAILMGEPEMWRSFDQLEASLRTGRTGFELANGRPMFEQLDEDHALAAVYQGAWAGLTDELADESIPALELERFSLIADIGGGHGQLLVAMLAAHPRLRGVLVERPAVLAETGPAVLASPVAERVSLQGADLPLGIPDRADAYVAKNVLHCMSDAEAVETLRALRDACGGRPQARLLIIEPVVSATPGFDWAKLMDIEVMVTAGGRERTEQEWLELLQETGFDLDRIVSLTPPQYLIEAVPRR